LVWVPPRYLRAPGGCLFVKGFWDFPLQDRGLLFAPCRINPKWLARRWTHVPNFVVNPDCLLGALFVRPTAHAFFFGDFFDNRWAKQGFIPWVDHQLGKQVPDPNFAYYQRAFQGNNGWEESLRRLYAARFSGDVPRPPGTLAQQLQLIDTLTNNRTANIPLSRELNITRAQGVTVLRQLSATHNLEVTALASLGKAPPSDANATRVVKLEAVSKDQRERQLVMLDQLRQIGDQRASGEKRLAGTIGPPLGPTIPQVQGPAQFRPSNPVVLPPPIPLTQPSVSQPPARPVNIVKPPPPPPPQMHRPAHQPGPAPGRPHRRR
jgi:hypothetical protein